MILFVTSVFLLFGAALCVPLRYKPPVKSNDWWTDIEGTPWDDKGPQLENSPSYNTFRHIHKQLDMYGYAQHVGRINRGQYYNPEMNLPGHRAFSNQNDFNPGDLTSGAFRRAPQSQKVVAEQVHVDLGFATNLGDIISVAPGQGTINTDGTIYVATEPGQHPCISNPCARVFPKNEAICTAAADTTIAKCARVIVDGGWSEWYTGQCRADCTQVRRRSCNNPPPSFGGVNCVGQATESQSCEGDLCVVDGGWSEWDSEQCRADCTQIRRRSCNNPPPSNGGLDCIGEATESQSCEGDLCGCSLGWIPFGSHCYLEESSNQMNHFDAQAVCEGHSANLLSITSAEEADFASSVFNSVWTGGYEKWGPFGGWVWVDGSTLETFGSVDWGAGEPDSKTGPGDCFALLTMHSCDCVALFEGKLYVIDCMAARPYVCKKAKEFSVK